MSGIDVIGFVSANCGLSVAARTTVRILAENSHNVAIADITLGGGRSSRDHTFDHLLLPEGAPLPHGIRLFHLNPPVIGQILEKKPAWCRSDQTFNVAVPFWELPQLPDFWIRDLQNMDLVLCPSRFIEQTVATTPMDPMPAVRHFPQTVFLPERHRPDRIRFGLPDQGLCFVVSFEIASDMERKNPWAAIEAFNGAFAPDENVWLVVKVSAALQNEVIEQQRERLRSIAAASDRIVILDRQMSYEEVISLYESCDVYVSLHRSEGLGLGLMEAMLLGKPVIATAWSGNMDFTTDANSCLVGYRLVPVRSPVYEQLLGSKRSLWADPDIADAARWMRQLYEHPDLRAHKGLAARASMSRRQEECQAGGIVSTIEACRAAKPVSVDAPVSRTAMAQNSVANAVTDSAILFSRVSALIKGNDIEGALALYECSRAHLSETPELVRFDDVMRRLREKASAVHR